MSFDKGIWREKGGKREVGSIFPFTDSEWGKGKGGKGEVGSIFPYTDTEWGKGRTEK